MEDAQDHNSSPAPVQEGSEAREIYPACSSHESNEKRLFKRLSSIFEEYGNTWDAPARDSWSKLTYKPLRSQSLENVSKHRIARSTVSDVTWAHFVILHVLYGERLFNSFKSMKPFQEKYPGADFQSYSFQESYKTSSPEVTMPLHQDKQSSGEADVNVPSEQTVVSQYDVASVRNTPETTLALEEKRPDTIMGSADNSNTAAGEVKLKQEALDAKLDSGRPGLKRSGSFGSLPTPKSRKISMSYPQIQEKIYQLDNRLASVEGEMGVLKQIIEGDKNTRKPRVEQLDCLETRVRNMEEIFDEFFQQREAFDK